MSTNLSLKLSGGPPQTATWVKIEGNGDLVVDHYDFSDVAQASFGNDVAFLLTISPSDKPRLLALLGAPDSRDSDEHLLSLLQERFPSYFEVKAWLEAHHVPFEKTFDSWA